MHLILLEELERDREGQSQLFSDKREPLVQKSCL